MRRRVTENDLEAQQNLLEELLQQQERAVDEM